MKSSQLPLEVFEEHLEWGIRHQRVHDHVKRSAKRGAEFGSELVGEGGFNWPIAAEHPGCRSWPRHQLVDRLQDVLPGGMFVLSRIKGPQPRGVVFGPVRVAVDQRSILDQLGYGSTNRFPGLNLSQIPDCLLFLFIVGGALCRPRQFPRAFLLLRSRLDQ